MPVWLAAGMMAQVVLDRVVSPPPVPMGIMGGLVLDGMPFFDGVKGQPYSLVESLKMVKTLADGTTVTNEREEHLMRDSEGRTRTEMYRKRDGTERVELIIIFDPVARVHMTLMPDMKRATVHHYPEPKPLTEEQKAADAARREALVAKVKAAAGGAVRKPRPRPDTEPLGQKDIAGLLAEGRRTTHVIPVGERGNDRELRQVFETWTSPDLKLELERTIDDPINGRSEMVVTQLDRGDPDAGMFKVPEGYKVNDEPVHAQ